MKLIEITDRSNIDYMFAVHWLSMPDVLIELVGGSRSAPKNRLDYN